MKLLITTQAVNKNHPILGFFHGWILEFAKYFDEIHIIALEVGEYDLPQHVHVYSLGKEVGTSRIKYTWRFYRYFAQIFFRVHVDYVFFHQGAIYNVLAAPFFFGRKLLRTQFYWWKTHGHFSRLDHTALWFVDRVFTAAGPSFPAQTQKKHVVGHAIDTDLFSYHDASARQPELLFVGRVSRSKRIEQVLEVTKQLRDEGEAITTRCIGVVADEEYYKELQQLVQNYELSDIVEFVPGVKHGELVAEYQRATVFMNPSDNDGLDKVVLEAMLSGTVPLTANRSFVDMLSQYDLYLPKGDINGYTRRVQEISAMTDDGYKALTEQLRADVVRDHALSTLTKRIFNDVT